MGEARETLVFWRLPFDESTFDSFSVSPECLVFCSERGKKHRVFLVKEHVRVSSESHHGNVCLRLTWVRDPRCGL